MAEFRTDAVSSGRTIPLAPGALPLVGHALAYWRDPLGFMREAMAWGPLVEVRVGPLRVILMREPADIERVVVGEHKHLFKDQVTRELRRILGDGLITSEGETWLRHRRLMAPVFQPASVATLGRVMVEVIERMLSRIVPGTKRDLHADMTQLTLEIVTKTLFASDLGSDAERVGPAIQELMDFFGTGITALVPYIDRLPLPAVRRANRALEELDRILMGIVRRARDRQTEGKDLLSMLLAARDDEGIGLGDRELRDHLMTFFLAGHETTALTLTFALVMLAKHPEVEDRLRAEMTEVLGDRDPTAADVSRMPMARSIILETMRLFPPAWAIGRETTVDLTIADYFVPKGSQLWMVQWVNHRDSRFFPEPERFRPERWANNLEKTLPKFAYYPFGGGPRVCIGNHFAMMEAMLALVMIARQFRLRLVDPNAPLELFPSITLRPKHRLDVVYEKLHTKTT